MVPARTAPPWTASPTSSRSTRPSAPRSPRSPPTAPTAATVSMPRAWPSTSWSAARAGWEVAEFVRANYAELGVSYVMYSQRIWSVDRASRGLALRGGPWLRHGQPLRPRPRDDVLSRTGVIPAVGGTTTHHSVGGAHLDRRLGVPDGISGGVRRPRPRAVRRRTAQAGRRPRADSVRARPGPRGPRGGVPPTGRQDPGRGAAERRLRPQPADPQPRGRPGRPRPRPRARLRPRPGRDRGAGPRPRAPTVRPQRGTGAGSPLRGVRRVRGQRPDAADPDPAGGEDPGPGRAQRRAQPHPGDARRLHEVPLAALGGDPAAGRPRGRLAARGGQVRCLRRRPVGLRLDAPGRRGRAALRRGAGDGPRRRRRLLRPRHRGRRGGGSRRPQPARPGGGVGDGAGLVPPRRDRRRPRRGARRVGGDPGLARGAVRREPQVPGGA